MLIVSSERPCVIIAKTLSLITLSLASTSQNTIKQIQSEMHAHTQTELIRHKFQGHTKRDGGQMWGRGVEKGLMRR